MALSSPLWSTSLTKIPLAGSPSDPSYIDQLEIRFLVHKLQKTYRPKHSYKLAKLMICPTLKNI